MNIKKLIVVAIILSLFYFFFVANFFITISAIAIILIALRIYKFYSLKKLNKLSSSKELFRESELGLFIALVAKVAKADGRVSELEAQLIGNMFDDISKIFVQKEKTRGILKEIFNDEKDKVDDTLYIASSLKRLIGKNRFKRRQYVEFLVQLAFVDNDFSHDEDKLLRQIVRELNLSEQEYELILSKFENMMRGTKQSMSLDQAYEILGVKESDDMNTVKKSYRKLVREYHPDIMKSKDKGEEYIEQATAKTQEINQAYQSIKEARK